MTVDLTRAEWRKASASQGNGECVEVAFVENVVATRDSKDAAGPVLLFAPSQWAAFTSGVQAGQFDN